VKTTVNGDAGVISIIFKDEIRTGAHRHPAVPLARRARRTLLAEAGSNKSAGSETIKRKAQLKPIKLGAKPWNGVTSSSS
jgi:hypothetical protein